MSAEFARVQTQLRRAIARFRRPLAAALAGLAAAGVLQVARPAPPAREPLVVAARDMEAGTQLGAGDLAVVSVPEGLVPAGAATTISTVNGRLLAGPMRRGEPVTDRRVLGRSLLAGYPADLVAFPVRVHDAASLAVVDVGDRIDVFAARDAARLADQVATAVRVVGLPATGADESAGADSGAGGLVVLAVTTEQARALAAAVAVAPLAIALLPLDPSP